jgi:hypothetical protein
MVATTYDNYVKIAHRPLPRFFTVLGMGCLFIRAVAHTAQMAGNRHKGMGDNRSWFVPQGMMGYE